MKTVFSITACMIAAMQTSFAAGTVDAGPVISLACSGATTETNLPKDQQQPRALETFRLAEAILAVAGYSPSLIFQPGMTAETYHRALVDAVLNKPSTMPSPTYETVIKLSREVGQAVLPHSLTPPADLGIDVTSPPPAHPAWNWLLDPTQSVGLRCLPQDPPKGSVERIAAPTKIPRIGLVASVDALGLEGDERKATGSALLGVKQTRTRQDDGSRKTVTTLSFDGTLGIRLSPNDVTSPSFLFANYTLSRERARPAAALDPGARVDDGDTNGLNIGLAINQIPIARYTMLSGQVGYVFDFVKDSRRGVSELTIVPGFKKTNLGLCSLGAYETRTFLGAKFRSRCHVSLDGGFSHVFRAGRATFKEDGNFLSLGGAVGFDLVPPRGADSGIVANAAYRYLPTIIGQAPDVSRVDASLKYRWWLPNGLAFDFGGTYKHGRELKTYTFEDAFELSFGIIY
jgi:hypothetical protein